MKAKFNSKIGLGRKFDPIKGEELRYEPMFFNADGFHAFLHGGMATKNFIASVHLETGVDMKDMVFDSRVHMLMPGWFPCIPGFHHDDVPRLHPDGQPAYEEFNPELKPYRSKHAFALLGDDICRTEFALGEAEFEDINPGEKYYKVWHPVVKQMLETGELTRLDAPMNQIVYFDDRTWHQGVQSTGSGWRLFCRISWNTDRVKNITNETRHQVQVYLENPMEGW